LSCVTAVAMRGTQAVMAVYEIIATNFVMTN